MHGRTTKTTKSEKNRAFSPSTYQAHLNQMNNFLNSNLAQAVSRQKSNYDKGTTTREFKAGDNVWLLIPTVKKLDLQGQMMDY